MRANSKILCVVALSAVFFAGNTSSAAEQRQVISKMVEQSSSDGRSLQSQKLPSGKIRFSDCSAEGCAVIGNPNGYSEEAIEHAQEQQDFARKAVGLGSIAIAFAVTVATVYAALKYPKTLEMGKLNALLASFFAAPVTGTVAGLATYETLGKVLPDYEQRILTLDTVFATVETRTKGQETLVILCAVKDGSLKQIIEDLKLMLLDLEQSND